MGARFGYYPVIVNLDEAVRKELPTSGNISKNQWRDKLDAVVVRVVQDEQPELICIIAPYSNIANWASRVATVARNTKPDSTIITGGPHATFQIDELLGGDRPLFDAVIAGSGEEKLKHILENFDDISCRYNHQGIATPTNKEGFSSMTKRETVAPLSPDYSLISNEQIGAGGTVVVAGRGCPGQCDFCLEGFYWNKATKPYFAGAEIVRNEIQALAALEVPVFGIGDSLIDLRPNRTGRFETFCETALSGLSLHEDFFMLTRPYMIDKTGCETFKRNGGNAIWVGVETASDTLRHSMGKEEPILSLFNQLSIAKECGLRTGAFFMFGHPGETKQSAQKSLDLMIGLFAKGLLDYVDPSIFVPYPGLTFYSDRETIIPDPDSWSDWDNWGRYGVPPVFSLDTMKQEEIYAFWKEAMRIKLEQDIREKRRSNEGKQSWKLN